MHRSRSNVAQALCALTVVVLTLAVASAAPPKDPVPTPTPDHPLDLNAAGVEELTALPGIGPALAERIVAFREEHGPFRRIEDLMRVRGVGEKSFQKLKDLITVSASR